jgi:hypothetical protein
VPFCSIYWLVFLELRQKAGQNALMCCAGWWVAPQDAFGAEREALVWAVGFEWAG